MPSSTIQTLGAENALFRHLREGTKPPKHGLTFQHIRVNTSPWWLRGRISRSLAASTATAAKADTYTHNDVATKLLADFEKRVADLLQRYPRPPPPKFRGPPARAYPGGAPPRSRPPGPGGPPRSRAPGTGAPPRREFNQGPPKGKPTRPKGRPR
jgi:nucleolar protein 56